MSFEENLRTLRLARGLTQPMLAEKADIEQSYLSKLENGRSKPSEDVLARLAQALEVKPDTLAQNGDETEERLRRWKRARLSAAAVAVLVATFLTGRATAFYPLSLAQLAHGTDNRDLLLELKGLAPSGIELTNLGSSSDGRRISIMGSGPDAGAAYAYLQSIEKQVGGAYEYIDMGPADPVNKRYYFKTLYDVPVSH